MESFRMPFSNVFEAIELDNSYNLHKISVKHFRLILISSVYVNVYMTPLTTAERSKHYRGKNKAKILEGSALRNRLKRAEMKSETTEKE